MKPYTESEPVFSESIQVTEPTDPAHADNINAGPKQLLQNTLVNRKEIEDLKQGNNEVEFDDTIPGEGEEPGGGPDPAETLEQITSGKSVPVLIGHIKRTLTGLLSLSQRALNIAMGKNQARVFATVDALDAWLSVPEHTAELKVGDNFYITAVDVPDYWWDGTQKQKLETQKVDLTTYDQKIAALEAKDSELNGNIASHNHAWTAITGKPSVYTPADHTHDGRYYTETEVNNLINTRARVCGVWGKTLSIKGPVHGLVVVNANSIFMIWSGGSSASDRKLYSKLIAGNETDLTFSFNANTNVITATLGWDAASISYTGL